MLASLSSILPSSHHSSQNDQISSFSRPTINDGDDDDDDNEIITAYDLPVKKKDKKEKHPNEVGVFRSLTSYVYSQLDFHIRSSSTLKIEPSTQSSSSNGPPSPSEPNNRLSSIR